MLETRADKDFLWLVVLAHGMLAPFLLDIPGGRTSHLKVVRGQGLGRELSHHGQREEDTLKGVTWVTFLKTRPRLLKFPSLPNRELDSTWPFMMDFLGGHLYHKV